MFNEKCTSDGCDTIVDYSQEIVFDQLVRGLNNEDIQKKVLACKEAEFNLHAVEKVIIAEETSKATQKESRTTNAGYVAPILTYRKLKN